MPQGRHHALTGTAADFLPADPALPALRRAAAGCRACPLWKSGTQTVFGEGAPGSLVMLVGEQPGDKEDLAGKPFVGPAGRLLDEALARAGIERSNTYVSNIVKHFKWEPWGNRRLHKKPGPLEIRACLPWLEAEIAAVQPQALVCLGSTAAQTLIAPEFRVSRERGRWVQSLLASHVIATVHPSSILRIPDQGQKKAAFEDFVDDLKKVAHLIQDVRRGEPAAAAIR
jgi:uracil-DNA glycosylase